MTENELAEAWVKENSYPYNDCPNIQDKLKQAYLAGQKVGKPKWHKVADGDLPLVHSTVLNEDCDKVEYLGESKWEAYSEYYERYVEIEPPIAWCEIPKYMGEVSG